MAKKTTRGTRLNEAQLKAYRARKAETVVQPQIRPVDEAVAAPVATTARRLTRGHVTAWGNVADEYQMIRADIRRLLLLTALMLIILIALWLMLG
ncbi:MAG TPA: hypothetical protein VFI42_00245 [Thermomicrobiaceae bacterium]|nr:hypothetical protein [Thermomicrobiaceae bacterium]